MTSSCVRGQFMKSCRYVAGHHRARSGQRDVSVRAAVEASPLALKAGACCLPHPEKIQTGGEDAFFISSDSKVMGVADGVGGWRESGIDPGEYSRTLMRVACEFFNNSQAKDAADSGMEETVRAAMAAAHQKTRMPGSSTACILALNTDDSAISAANLGDSGFVIIRNGTVVFQTPPLLHFFDCPYQLGAFPEHVDATNYPSDADTFTFNVMPGDIVVLGTDGLWDNIPLDEIAQLVPDTDDAVEEAAELLATAARQHADDPDYDSPYTKSAREEGIDLPWWEKVLGAKFESGQLSLAQLVGGKLDDITVVVARVTDVAPEAPSATEESAAPDAQASEAASEDQTSVDSVQTEEAPQAEEVVKPEATETKAESEEEAEWPPRPKAEPSKS